MGAARYAADDRFGLPEEVRFFADGVLRKKGPLRESFIICLGGPSEDFLHLHIVDRAASSAIRKLP